MRLQLPDTHYAKRFLPLLGQLFEALSSGDASLVAQRSARLALSFADNWQ